jgi:hypothetical protein
MRRTHAVKAVTQEKIKSLLATREQVWGQKEIRPLRTETQILHGQKVKVKIYPMGTAEKDAPLRSVTVAIQPSRLLRNWLAEMGESEDVVGMSMPLRRKSDKLDETP